MTDTELAGQSPYIAPQLTLRVGVAGHLPGKLENADLPAIRAQSRAVLECLAEVTRRLLASNDAIDVSPFARGMPSLRLATSLAPGADTVVSEDAKALDYRLNVILPFREEIYAQDFDDTPVDGPSEREIFRKLLKDARALGRYRTHDGGRPPDLGDDFQRTHSDAWLLGSRSCGG